MLEQLQYTHYGEPQNALHFTSIARYDQLLLAACCIAGWEQGEIVECMGLR